MEDIGRKLRALRLGRGLTQRDVATRLGMARATLSNYEVGRRTPHLSELRRLGDLYGVGLDYFGVSESDPAFELLSRAREVFSGDLPRDSKEKLYRDLMRIYLEAGE